MAIVKLANGVDVAIDNWALSNLDLAKSSIRNDLDHVFTISGDERSGKSTLVVQWALYCDPTFNLSRMCYTASAFIKAVQEAAPYTAVVYDEAMNGLSSRESMTYTNRTLNKVFAECGQKNLFLFVLIPDFFSLDQYVAVHRSRVLIQTYFADNFQRGQFAFFSKEKKRRLYFEGKRYHDPKAVKADFYGTFSKVFPLDYAEYKRLKLEALKEHHAERETRTMENVKFPALLSWMVKDQGMEYAPIIDGLAKYGVHVQRDGLRQAVYRFTKDKGVGDGVKSESE